MISGIIYDNDEKERALLAGLVKDGIAVRSDDESRIIECEDQKLFFRTIKELDINDFCCLDFGVNGGKESASLLRKTFPSSALLLLVDMTTSPREYVRPDILPTAIILRPSDGEGMRLTVEEFLDSVLSSGEKGDDQSISIDTKEGVTKIPYDSISYVEASAKKVYIRTKKEEYGYYETLDNLENILPEYFFRCHRGYIVNLHKVKKFVGAESTLYLSDGSMLPVSRSYKSDIREVLK